MHDGPNIPKGGSPSPDKVLAQKNDKSKDKFVNGLDVLSHMEDSDSDEDEKNYGKLPEHEKRLIDLMRAASSGNVDAQQILHDMGFVRGDG